VIDTPVARQTVGVGINVLLSLPATGYYCNQPYILDEKEKQMGKGMSNNASGG